MAKRRDVRPAPDTREAAPPADAPSWPTSLLTMHRWVIPALVVLLLTGVGSQWWNRVPAAPVRPTRPNIVLVTLDTTRADRLGAYGYAGAVTPNLDRLARDGVRFVHALSPVPLTLPAHASVMTGRNPYGHGVRNNGYFVLGPDVPTLAERFAAAGYDTAAFVSSFVLDRQFGLARGFAHYDDALDPPRGPSDSLAIERRGDRTVAAAVSWLSARATATPYFVWVHLYDAHEPYDPPATFRASFEGRAYDGEIAFQDSVVGELLARVGYGGPGTPVVVVAGDHGESLGDHGESTHGLFVYEGAVRVPLIMSWPGVLPARVVEPAVALADVAPTLAEIAGLPAFADVHGESLMPVLEGAPPTASRGIYAETYFPQFFMGWAPLRSLRDGRWKYIDAPEPELYDVVADPGETTNRAGSETAQARGLRRRLEEAVRGHDQPAASAISGDAQRKLAALGYVSTPTPRLPAAGPAPDPKRMVGDFERLTGANRALTEGRATQAAEIARQILARDPGNHFARLVLGRAQLAGGDHRAAIATLKTYVAAVPGSADTHHWIALAHLRLGDRERALAEEEAAIAIDPGHAAAIALRAGLLFSMGKRDEGVAALAAAVDARPTHPTLRTDYADLLADAGRAADAEAQYRRVLEARGDDMRARAGLGMLLAKTGQLAAAVAELTRVLDADPRHEEARIERAAAFARLGRAAEARADLERLTGPEVRPDIRRTAQRELARVR